MLKIALHTFKNDENHTQNSKIHIQNSGCEVRCGENVVRKRRKYCTEMAKWWCGDGGCDLWFRLKFIMLRQLLCSLSAFSTIKSAKFGAMAACDCAKMWVCGIDFSFSGWICGVSGYNYLVSKSIFPHFTTQLHHFRTRKTHLSALNPPLFAHRFGKSKHKSPIHKHKHPHSPTRMCRSPIWISWIYNTLRRIWLSLRRFHCD